MPCDVEIFYPSEESDLQSENVTEFASIKETNPIKQQIIGEGTELAKIGQMLVGTCCGRLCLRHLTATDIISSKADYVALSKDKKKLYLFNKLKDGSSECDAMSDKLTTKFFIAGKEVCEMHYKQFSSDPWMPKGVGEHLIMVWNSICIALLMLYEVKINYECVADNLIN